MDDDINDQSDPFFHKAKWNVIQFALVCTYTVGFDGLWRFPMSLYGYTAYFLIPYYVMLVVFCLPVVYVQIKLGSLMKKGILGIFCHFMPILKGIAGAALLTSFFVSIYENVYVGYTIYYMFCSLSKPFIWDSLGNSSDSGLTGSSSAKNYFQDLFLQIGDASFSNLGDVPWYLGLILMTSWLLVWACICRGANLFGLIVYATGPLSMVVMLVVIVYGYTAVPGASKSVAAMFYSYSETTGITQLYRSSVKDTSSTTASMNPMDQLKSWPIWIHALMHHVNSLGLWSGVLPMFGYHLQEKKHVKHLPWIILVCCHGVLPLLSSMMIGPYVYGLAQVKGLSFGRVMTQGMGLSFITMPEAFTKLDVPCFISFSFFLCMLLFALHHQVVILLAIQDTITWFHPSYLKSVFRRFELMSGVICILAFFVGLPYVTKGGSEFYAIVDSYIMRLLFVLIIFSIPPFSIAYMRKENFNSKFEKFVMTVWFGIAGFSVSMILVYHFMAYVRPYWIVGLEHHWFGWIVAASPLLICIPLGVVHAMWSEEGKWWRRLMDACKPREEGDKIVTVAHLTADADGNVGTPDWEECGTIKMIRKTSKVDKTQLEIGIKPTGRGAIANL